MPTLPPWEGMHPLIVHLPIGLLTVAPLPALLAVLMSSRRTMFLYLTFFVVLLGMAGTVVATMSGEAAEESMRRRGLDTAAVHSTLEEHAELGETTRNTYLVLTFVFGGIAIGARKGKLSGVGGTAASLVFLAGTVGGLLLIANTADHGGRLVHRFGIHAPLGPVAAGHGHGDAAGPGAADHDDDD